MTRAGSGEEVEALVADYFAMLRCELAGVPYCKADHRRRLGALLRDRSEPSIEVKTTKYGRETPFFVSGHELRVSEDRAALYHLYRLFAFRDSPRLFTLPGALSSTCRLEPRTFIATVA